LKRWRHKKFNQNHKVDRKIQAWLEEQPEYKELGNILSAKDHGILVDRCDKRMKERGISGITLSKKIDMGKHAVNYYPSLNSAFALLNSFLSVNNSVEEKQFCESRY
jgi:hypothetical protein